MDLVDMKRFLSVTVAIALFPILFAGSRSSIELPPEFQILPLPKEITVNVGEGLAFWGLESLVLAGDTERPAVMPALLDPLPTLPSWSKTEKGNLTLVLADGDPAPDSHEGYFLEVENGSVRVISRGQAGLFYGCQTLQQLLEDARDTGTEIPALQITDWPEISYRAVHFDVKHHLDRMEYYYGAIDRLAEMKINAVIFELEDKLRYRRQPVVGAGNAMSIEEVAALTRYARERHIEISPLIQGLGHAAFILKHDEYRDLREEESSDWAFCPLNERTYEVQFDLYLDALEATPGSRYLHIGGDEVSVGVCEQCLATGLTPFELQMKWLQRVADFAAEQGRIPIMWDDMPLKHAGVYNTTHRNLDEREVERIWAENGRDLDRSIDLFPKNCVYMRWNYGSPMVEGNIRTLEWYQQNNLGAMAATAAQTTWSIHPRNGSNAVPIRDFNRLTAKYGLDGILCTAWDDSSPHMEFYWRGWFAHADFAWSPEGRGIEDFNAAYGQRRFGPAGRTIAPLIHDDLEAALNAGNTILRERPGRRGPFPPGEALNAVLTFPDLDTPGEWSRRNEQRLETAREELVRFRNLEDSFDELLLSASRGRFALRLMNALSEVQACSWRLLLATAECDQKGRGVTGSALLAEVENFRKAETHFLEVFSETRFPNNPPGYQLDQNFHPHLANVRNDPSWIFALESGYCTRAIQWLHRN